jgi:hypothetical protein
VLLSLVGVAAYPLAADEQPKLDSKPFDASTCAGISGKDADDKWCRASCGAGECPASFCTCAGGMPEGASSETNTKLTPEEQQAQKRVAERDADTAKRDEMVASTSQERDNIIKKRDEEIASRNSEVAPTSTDESAKTDEVIAKTDEVIAKTDEVIAARDAAIDEAAAKADEVIAARDAAIAAQTDANSKANAP